MTWQNVPCAATLPAVSQACPDGWLEVHVEHVSPRSMPGGGDPQEADSNVSMARAWGLDYDAHAALSSMFLDLYQQGDQGLSGIPHGATALFKIVRGSLLPGVPTFTLTAHWGTGGAPVYTLDEHPSLTGQQPAPQPGRGDMWASVIERYDGQINRVILERFRGRAAQGLAQYGVPLQAGNGRDVCEEIVTETLDRIAYAEQAAQERPELADIMHGLQDRDIATLGGLLGVYGRLDVELGPEAPKVPHPIDDRPAVGTAEGRMAALIYLGAIELERRSREAARKIENGELAEQVRLADNETDLALIGKMAGRAGASMFAMLGIGPGGTRLPGGPR